MLKKDHIFVVVAGRYSDLAYLSVRNKQLDGDDVSHSVFNAFYQGKILYVGKTLWDTQAMTVVQRPQEKMIAVSGDGFVFTYVGGQETQERIAGVVGEVRNLAVIDGYGYACGMRRQVFCRKSENQWTPMHAPKPTEKDEGRVVGFEAIDGFSEAEIYAAGWGGEIWSAKNGEWQQIDSPTTEILTAVECNDREVFIAGRNGLLLRGRNSSWEVIDTDGITDDFWDLSWFNDRLYVSSQARIYEFHQGSLQPTNTGKDRPSSCLKLSAADGVMWSLGAEDVFMFDGANWTRIE